MLEQIRRAYGTYLVVTVVLNAMVWFFWGLSILIVICSLLLSLVAASIWHSIDFGRLFGPFCLFVVMLALAGSFIMSPQFAADRIPDFIALAAISFAILYSFIFLIAPEFEINRGLRFPGQNYLAVLLVGGFVFTGVFVAVYADRTFLWPAENNTYTLQLILLINNALASLGLNIASDGLISQLVDFHFLILTVVFTAIDVVFWNYSSRHHRKFMRIIFFIDIPIFIAVVGTVSLKGLLHGPERDAFESGAISFQFVTGSIAAYMLDNYLVILRCIGRRGAMFPSRVTSLI